jgi:hypothetical protein
VKVTVCSVTHGPISRECGNDRASIQYIGMREEKGEECDKPKGIHDSEEER